MSDTLNQSQVETPPEPKKPNEVVGYFFSSGIKITDPETGNVLVQMRAD
jgi:hypothetical protein